MGATIAIAMIAAACSGGSNAALDDAIAGLDATESGGVDATDTGDESTGADGERFNGDVVAPDLDPTPLPTDDAVRIGVLDNGLTYYVRHNRAPGSNVDLRLVVNAGSVDEPEVGGGIAHFLEHMLFNGTELYPGNDLDAALRELGAEIGADLNAYTTYDETVYTLAVSTLQPGSVDTAFEVLSQWAHAALLAPADVAGERGVVRDELRGAVETSDGFILAEFDSVYTEDTPYEGRGPIGTADSVESMEAATLQAFYDRWYQPSNMAVVVVGDMSVDSLERLVEDHFSEIAGGDTPGRSDTARTLDRGAATYVLSHPDQARSYLSLDIPIPVWDAGTVGGERLNVIEMLMFTMLDNHLNDAFQRGDMAQTDEPFAADFAWTRTLRYIGTNFEGDDLAQSLTDWLSELYTVESNGFSEDDLDRAKESFRAILDFAIESSSTKQDWEHADLLSAHFLNGAGIDDINSTINRAEALLGELTAVDVTGHLRWLLRQSGPIAIAVGPDETELPTIQELAAAIAAAAPRARADAVEAINALIDPPDPVEAISSSDIDVVDGVEWEFENGARVMFVQSDIADGVVDVLAVSGGGWSILDPGDGAISWMATSAVDRSGIGELSRTQIDRFLAGISVSLNSFIDEHEEGLVGAAATSDIETLFQLLHLAVVSPRVDDAAFAQAVNDGENLTSLAGTDPSWRSYLAYIDARFPDDPWQQAVPSQDQLRAMTTESMLDLYERRLASVDDLIVAVVGDVDEDVVQFLARQYVGTLPAGEPDTFVDRWATEPSGILDRTVLLDNDVADASVLVVHEHDMEVTVGLQVRAAVLETIINGRLFLTIREDLGASYGGFASLSSSYVPRHGISSYIDASGDPTRVTEIRDVIVAELADLVANGPTDDEFDQAIAIVTEDYTFISNLDILEDLIARSQVADSEVATQQRQLRQIQNVDHADVQALAGLLYGDGNRIEVIRTVG